MIKTIVGEEYKYPKVPEIVSTSLKEEKGRVILLLGQPGSGKSVFMSQLHDAFYKEKSCNLVSIRAEYLKEEDQPKEIFEAFTNTEIDKPKVLILDSLDVLAYSRRKELQEWLFYVDKLKNLKFMTIICASRKFEAEHLYPMNKQEWSEKIDIELLPEEFIRRVFSKIHYDYEAINPKLKEFLRTPLHLKIASEIISKDYDPKDIVTLHGLYSKLCESLDIKTDEMKILVAIASQMISDKTVMLSFPLISVQLIESIKKMERPGITAILQVDSDNRNISFSHQTLIDYFIAWDVVNRNQSLINFILAYNQSLFIRPTIRHILGFLRSNSEKRLFEELNGIFLFKQASLGFKQDEVKVRIHVKVAVIANIASWDKPTENESIYLLNIFRNSEKKEGDVLLIQFFNSHPNEGWFNVLKDKYILLVIKKNEHDSLEYRTVISFLISIASKYPFEVLDIGEILLSQGPNRIAEWYFHQISDEFDKMKILDVDLQKKYVHVLEEAVRNKYISYYYEKIVCCQRVAKYCPEKGIELYFECVKNELDNKESKINSSQGSITESYDRVLPFIYEKIPFKVILLCTDLFESILSENYEGDKNLWDSPNQLLYAEYEERYGLEAFYDWYKNQLLEFCEKLSEESISIIRKLESSKWETPKQLAMLCKLKNPLHYKDNVVEYVNSVLKSDLTDNAMFAESELYIVALAKVLDILDSVGANKIIDTILGLKLEDRLQVRVWIWGPLHNIPMKYRNPSIEDKLKEITKKYEFEKEYKHRPPIKSSGFKSAQSPIPADELRKVDSDKLYDILTKNYDLKENWDYEKDIFYGGIRELAQTVASVFIEDLDKYKSIIQRLAKDEKYNEYLIWLFYALSNRNNSFSLQEWVIDIIKSTYTREALEMSLSRCLEKFSDEMSKDQLDKLKDVIIKLSESGDPKEDTFFKSRQDGYSNDALGNGINTVRGSVVTLVIKLLRFKETWLENILVKLSNDKTISVRAALVRYLPYAIKPLSWDKCYGIFSNSFKNGPEEYHELVSQFLQYSPKDKFNQVKPIIESMYEKREGPLGEALASTLTIFYLRDMYPEASLIGLLNDKLLTKKGKEESFHILANELKYESFVDKSIKIINKLLEQDNAVEGRCGTIFMQARIEDLNKISPLVKQVVAKPKIRGEALYHILEYLEKCILIDPLQVFSLLEILIENIGEEFNDASQFIPASHSGAPLNIINTILECYPEAEDRAMKALDNLIKLGWSGVDKYLYAFDRL